MNQKKIMFKTHNKVLILNIFEILYFSADGNYSTIKMKSEKKHLVSIHLKSIEKQLPPFIFFRCHKSWIINLNFVKEICQNQSCSVVLENNEKIKVSDRKTTELKKALQLFCSF
ncbi:MAG: hypothetical protein A2W91_19660 [Bacteroidetes bacterium GWF2_38_335]|nr:MAG: hypothetical protein A2W91_19660 [Bacteroidetes bacterium GWF2_38_335]OFY79973.1 MAG: hypothetical protein A2281_11060 [Bacteroidetes bacterium RIFOXYA12_FULL_38_20]HBS86433.1 hypothetical protein [Bacteroidales bacterium]